MVPWYPPDFKKEPQNFENFEKGQNLKKYPLNFKKFPPKESLRMCPLILSVISLLGFGIILTLDLLPKFDFVLSLVGYIHKYM